jgi:hypothetical protein
MNTRHKENNAQRSVKGKYDQWSDKMISGILGEYKSKSLVQ